MKAIAQANSGPDRWRCQDGRHGLFSAPGPAARTCSVLLTAASSPPPDRASREDRFAVDSREPRRLAGKSMPAAQKIGRASCRERVWMAVGAGTVKKRKREQDRVIG